MKIAGLDLTKAHEELIVLPRGEQEIVFVAKAVLSFKEFEKLCPEPEPPEYIGENGKKTTDFEDLGYRQQLIQRASRRMNWLVLKSLEDSPGLEWEQVDLQNPKTWDKWDEELEEANFTPAEINRIRNAVFIANALNEDRIKEARDAFLNRRAQEAAK